VLQCLGSAAKRDVVIRGMLAATVIAVFCMPMFYYRKRETVGYWTIVLLPAWRRPNTMKSDPVHHKDSICR
jgi:hypothetical protein